MSAAMASVVRVRRGGGFGSGFVVYASPQAILVMTCKHCVAGVGATRVSFPGEIQAYNATVERTSDELDIALLRFAPDEKRLTCVALEFAQLTTPLNCGGVQMIGFHGVPVGTLLYPGVFDGNISGDPADGFIRCDYPSKPGSSGAPVLKDGKVVGVNCRHTGAIRYAASVVGVCTAMREWLHMENTNAGFDDMLPALAQA